MGRASGPLGGATAERANGKVSPRPQKHNTTKKGPTFCWLCRSLVAVCSERANGKKPPKASERAPFSLHISLFVASCELRNRPTIAQQKPLESALLNESNFLFCFIKQTNDEQQSACLLLSCLLLHFWAPSNTAARFYGPLWPALIRFVRPLWPLLWPLLWPRATSSGQLIVGRKTTKRRANRIKPIASFVRLESAH